MDTAQSTMNVLYAVDADNVLVSLTLAALVPFAAKRLYRFFHTTWPQALHRWLTHSLLDREVSIVEQDGDRNSGDMNKLVDNQVFIEIILEYVGHLATRARQQKAQREERASGGVRSRDGDIEGNVGEKTAEEDDDRKDGDVWLPQATSLADLPYAGYRYAAVLSPGGGKSSASSRKCEQARGGDNIGSYLAQNFRLTLAPTGDVAMEVEPGLYVRYLSSTQTLEQVKERRRARAQTTRGDDAAIAASGAVEDYLLYDLINRLQENGHRKKKRDARRRLLHGEDEEDAGNDTFLRPFFAGNESTEEDESRSRGDSSEYSSGTDDEAAKQQEQAPRQIMLQCRTLRTHAQRDAYLQHYAEPGLSEVERERVLLPRNRIEAFAARARAWYTRQIADSDSGSLFLFYPAASEAATALKQRKEQGGGGGGSDGGSSVDGSWTSMGGGGGGGGGERDLQDYMHARRYPIPGVKEGGGKTFRSLFFTQKQRVLRLLNDFRERTGKFAVPGMPHRLTWLVHGPPGTGKTSLVKAMARHLGRHVVVLQMGTVRTARLLAAWMNEAKVTCTGEQDMEIEVYTDDDSYQNCWGCDKEVRLKPEEVIYLLEDVDAIGKIDGLLIDDPADEEDEKKRSEDSNATRSGSSGETSSDTATPSTSSAEGDETDHEDVGNEDSEDESETSSDARRRKAKEEKQTAALMEAVLKELRGDRLTTEGLVSVFNGAAAPDGRIVVMTTNHPERLDPRLLHPSVLSLKIDMDDFDAEQATQMIQHYYPAYRMGAAGDQVGESQGEESEERQQLTDAVYARVATILRRHDVTTGSGEKINPARLEQACAECDSVEELLITLESGRYELHDNVF